MTAAPSISRILEALAGRMTHTPLEQEPLSSHSTYRVGGPARLFLEVESEDELSLVLTHIAAEQYPYLLLGMGSNVLISDEGFDGVVIRLGAGFSHLLVGEEGSIVAGAAVILPSLSKAAAEHGLSGLEFCEGIPGTLGGGIKMNAGAHGSDLSKVLTSVTWIDASTGKKTEGLPVFGYRTSSLQPDDVITAATFKTTSAPNEQVTARMAEIRAQRRSAQPPGRSAGSVFRNPDGDSAGRLIEAAGLKGLSRGGAMISEKHANFIINTGSAHASDILELMKEARSAVDRDFGILLEPEIKLIGFGPEPLQS